MSAPLLEARALTVEIAAKTVCTGLALRVARSERWAVLGVNGVGKTTLLRTLAGLRRPRAGEVALDGQVLTALTGRERARRRGMLLQSEHDESEATVIEVDNEAVNGVIHVLDGVLNPRIRLSLRAAQPDGAGMIGS